MATTRKHDWGLIVIGILLALCGIVFAFSPVETLVTLTIFAGVFFLVAGIFDIINYVRFHKTGLASGWTIFYAILDIILGLMFLIHPVALAGIIPWVIGIFVLVFGVYECVAAFSVRKSGASVWGWILFSGIIGIVLGLCFFFLPASFVLYIAFFLILRGVTLMVVGWNTATVN